MRPETTDRPPFDVRPLKQAKREARVGKLFSTEVERGQVIRMLRLLKHWPPDLPGEGGDGVGFDYEIITHRGQIFHEVKINESWLSHTGKLRVFVWVDDQRRVIWVIHGYWKDTRSIPDFVKTRVANRLRKFKGGLQDGCHEAHAAAIAAGGEG